MWKEQDIYIEKINEKKEKVFIAKIKNLLKDIEVKAGKSRNPFWKIGSIKYVHKNKRKYYRKKKHKKQECD